MQVRTAEERDAPSWLRMRRALWPEENGDHEREIRAYFAGGRVEPLGVLVAEHDGALVGFVELSIRSCAEGCRTNRVAYLEGWFVELEALRRGVGRALVAAAEEWGRSKGCRELGSDTPMGNDRSAAAHRALGFEEVGAVRCFRKDL
jgi:aminoglycoside 6'-N-acetyltransferase I